MKHIYIQCIFSGLSSAADHQKPMNVPAKAVVKDLSGNVNALKTSGLQNLHNYQILIKLSMTLSMYQPSSINHVN